jgi:hypothetical protein
MNKKFVISSVALFVVSMIFGFVVHGLLLAGDYGQLPTLMRTQEDAGAHFHFMIVAHLLMAIGLTWLYRQGREDKPWMGQGLRFGAAIAVAMTIPIYLIYHAVMPFPLTLVTKQIAFDTVAMLIVGLVAAAINRD